MKTAEQAAKDFNDSHVNGHHPQKWVSDIFKAGAEFAQRWIQIDRCTNGYITANSLSDIERNLPVIMNDEDGDKDDEYIIIKYISDLLDMDESFTHWRPINLK